LNEFQQTFFEDYVTMASHFWRNANLLCQCKYRVYHRVINASDQESKHRDKSTEICPMKPTTFTNERLLPQATQRAMLLC